MYTVYTWGVYTRGRNIMYVLHYKYEIFQWMHNTRNGTVVIFVHYTSHSYIFGFSGSTHLQLVKNFVHWSFTNIQIVQRAPLEVVTLEGGGAIPEKGAFQSLALIFAEVAFSKMFYAF